MADVIKFRPKLYAFEAHCSFCLTPTSQASRMLSGGMPDSPVYVCGECLVQMLPMVRQGDETN